MFLPGTEVNYGKRGKKRAKRGKRAKVVKGAKSSSTNSYLPHEPLRGPLVLIIGCIYVVTKICKSTITTKICGKSVSIGSTSNCFPKVAAHTFVHQKSPDGDSAIRVVFISARLWPSSNTN
jgi:hypothetical protein